MMKSPLILSHKNQQSGFTLLEVLITLLILAIGLLGLAGLQAIGLNQNLSAYHRSQATQAAYSIADRIRANQAASANYRTALMAPIAAAQKAACNTGAGCSAADMAENDLFEWNAALLNSLPNEVPAVDLGDITLNGTIFTITINWDDNRDGNVDGNDPNFRLSFQP